MDNKPWYRDTNSPIWMAWRQVLMLVVLVIVLTYAYENGWSASDWKTILSMLISVGAFDAFKKYITSDKS